LPYEFLLVSLGSYGYHLFTSGMAELSFPIIWFRIENLLQGHGPSHLNKEELDLSALDSMEELTTALYLSISGSGWNRPTFPLLLPLPLLISPGTAYELLVWLSLTCRLDSESIINTART
jgi:hypothetical protein